MTNTNNKYRTVAVNILLVGVAEKSVEKVLRCVIIESKEFWTWAQSVTPTASNGHVLCP